MRYQGKRVIWKNKGKQWQLVFGCALFVVAILFIGRERSPLMFWTGLIFFGGGGLFALLSLLNPATIYVTPGSALGEKLLQEFDQTSTLGEVTFEYTPEGFYFSNSKSRVHVDWKNVLAAFGYKEDLMTYDNICLDIFLEGGSHFTLTEEMPGWEVFNDHLHQNIPSIPPNWYINIAVPAFDTKLTLLYEKHGRSLADAGSFYYKEA